MLRRCELQEVALDEGSEHVFRRETLGASFGGPAELTKNLISFAGTFLWIQKTRGPTKEAHAECQFTGPQRGPLPGGPENLLIFWNRLLIKNPKGLTRRGLTPGGECRSRARRAACCCCPHKNSQSDTGGVDEALTYRCKKFVMGVVSAVDAWPPKK